MANRPTLLYRWNQLKAEILWPYWAYRSWCSQFEPSCGNACEWVYPYGFVPEDGCPVHDRPSLQWRVRQWLRRYSG